MIKTDLRNLTTQNRFKNTKAYYSFLALRLLLALFLFSAARVIFFLFNFHYFNHISAAGLPGILFGGIYFDISSVFALNSVFIILLTIPHPYKTGRVYRAFTETAYLVPNVTGLVLNLGDAGYYPFTLKRLTFDIFDFLKSDRTSVSMLPKFLIDFWPITVIGLALIVSAIIAARKIKLTVINESSYPLSRFAAELGLFLASVILSVIFFRGGLQLKPINIITAGEFTSAENVPLVLNTPFTLIKTINRKGLERKNYYSNSELDSIFSPIHYPRHAGPSQSKKINIVIIIMESFSSEHSGRLNQSINDGSYQGFTPFLDSLMGLGYTCINAYANGKRSIEGIPAIVAGLPTLMDEAYITSNYAGNRINSLASLLKPEGYTTAFYHGGANGTMGFESFTRMAGYENYYGRNEYHDRADYDGNWGIWDEPYFQYFADNLNKSTQPFLATIFSLSSHHPYQVPEIYKGKFRKGKLEIQQSIMYADYALRQFFKKAAGMPWYKNTLFVITADHTSEAALPVYQTRVGNFRIPILFYSPALGITGTNSRTVQQTDIMPTILNLAGYDKPYVAFGSDIFDTTANRFAMTYLNGTYQLIKDGHALQFNGAETTGLFDIASDPLLKSNLLGLQPGIERGLSRLMKAVLQQYNNRLIENRLVF